MFYKFTIPLTRKKNCVWLYKCRTKWSGLWRSLDRWKMSSESTTNKSGLISECIIDQGLESELLKQNKTRKSHTAKFLLKSLILLYVLGFFFFFYKSDGIDGFVQNIYNS